MKKSIIILVFAALFCLFAGSLFAQGSNGESVQRLRYAIERTDEIIDKAKEIVAESGSERARLLLQTAIRIQEMSRGMVRETNMNTFEATAVKAGQHTLDARGKAQRAIAITRKAGENEEYVRRRLERTDELIHRIDEKTSTASKENIRKMLDSAREKQRRAIEFFRDRRLKPSLQLTIQVEKSLEHMAQRMTEAGHEDDRYLAITERYFQLADRIKSSQQAEKSVVREGLEAARNLMDKSDKLYINGQYRKAMEAVDNAVKILQRLVQENRESGQIETALGNLQTRAGGLGEQVRKTNNNQVKKLYKNAMEHLEKGKEAYSRNQFETAAVQLQAARQLLARVSKMLGDR